MSNPDPEIGSSLEAGGIRANYLDVGAQTGATPVLLVHGSGSGATNLRLRRCAG